LGYGTGAELVTGTLYEGDAEVGAGLDVGEEVGVGFTVLTKYLINIKIIREELENKR